MAVLTLDLCDGNTGDWTASANVTESKDTFDYKEGTGSRKFVIGGDFTTGKIAYKNIATINASSYRGVSFYIKSDIEIVANALRLDLCSDDAGNTPVDSFTISEALPAGEWLFLHYDSGSALGSAIESIALVALLDPGSATIHLDKIEACNIFYIDAENGNNSNDGTTWANAWQDLTNGATSSRIAPGDCIHIAKSPDPVSIGNATWTDGSSTVTLSSAQTQNIEMCDGNTGDWVASANVTESKETTYYKEGIGSRKFVIEDAFTTGKIAYKNIATLDLSSYQKISFWIRANLTGGVAANTFRLDLCSDDSGNIPVNSFTIAIRLETTRWYCITLSPDAGPGNLGSAIESVALYAIADPGTATIYLDNIIACTTNGLNLQSLLGKNQFSDPTWWPIKSINGPTVILGEHTQIGATAVPYSDNVGSGGYETVTTYKRETVKISPATSISTANNTVQKSGTVNEKITFSGGWNKSTNIRDGITLWDGFNGWGAGIQIGVNYSYIRLEHIGMVRSGKGLFLYGCFSCDGYDIYSISCSEYGIYITDGVANCILNKIHSIACTYFNITNSAYNNINNIHIKGMISTNGGLYIDSGYENYIYNLIAGRNTTADIVMNTGTLYLINSKLLTSTKVYFKTTCRGGSFVAIQNGDQIDGNHKKFVCLSGNAYFTVSPDASDSKFYDVLPSTRVVPGSESIKSQVKIASVAVDSGNTVTISVKIRESISSDGTDYNGNRIELVLLKNPALEIMEDKILATATSLSEGTFETLSGTTPEAISDGVLEFALRCDGTTGWINFDTVTVS